MTIPSPIVLEGLAAAICRERAIIQQHRGCLTVECDQHKTVRPTPEVGMQKVYGRICIDKSFALILSYDKALTG